MSFIRYTLASWKLAFVPKLGVRYRYAIEGPFEIGPVLIPKEIKRGFVLYEIHHIATDSKGDKYVSEHACPCGVFASMCVEG
jgi:hypothetical protein